MLVIIGQKGRPTPVRHPPAGALCGRRGAGHGGPRGRAWRDAGRRAHHGGPRRAAAAAAARALPAHGGTAGGAAETGGEGSRMQNC